MSAIKPEQRDVLLVIDVQNDFCPGGALEVPRGDEVVPVINGLITRFDHVILTQDWHPRRTVRLRVFIRARKHSVKLRWTMVRKHCGRITVFRAVRVLPSMMACPGPRRRWSLARAFVPA